MALKANKKKKRAKWQGRRKAAAVAEAAKESREGQDPPSPVAVLASEPEARKDLALIGVAVQDDWPVPPEAKAIVIERMLGIIEKKSVATITKDGAIFDDEDAADKNAIAATARLSQMVTHNTRKRDPQKSSTNQVIVNVNSVDERRNQTLRILERAGAARGIRLDGSGSPQVIVCEDGGE